MFVLKPCLRKLELKKAISTGKGIARGPESYYHTDYSPKFEYWHTDNKAVKRNIDTERLTAAAKNVLSPISESTVMASDLVKPFSANNKNIQFFNRYKSKETKSNNSWTMNWEGNYLNDWTHFGSTRKKEGNMPEIKEREIVESEERISSDNKIGSCELLNKMSRLKLQIGEDQKNKRVRVHGCYFLLWLGLNNGPDFGSTWVGCV